MQRSEGRFWAAGAGSGPWGVRKGSQLRSEADEALTVT